jgi:hypothetical protein
MVGIRQLERGRVGDGVSLAVGEKIVQQQDRDNFRQQCGANTCLFGEFTPMLASADSFLRARRATVQVSQGF